MITSLAMRARIPVLVALIALMAAGVYGLTNLRVQLFPDVDFPLISVSTLYPGADVDTVLADVTIPLEEALAQVPDSVNVSSITSANFSLVIQEFDFGTDMAEAERAARELVDAITLPDGVQSFQLARANPEEFPIMELSVFSELDFDALHALISAEVLPGLRDVPGLLRAEVPLGSQAGVTVTRTNGRPSLSINVLKEADANTIDVSDGVLAEIELAKDRLPSDIEFVTIMDQGPEIRTSINTLTREVILGAILAVMVIFAFLLSVRPTIVTSISIPASVLGGLLIMAWQDMSLNIITIGALAIAVGRVVDDSIVVMENIYRHIQAGEARIPAALAATREVTGAITTSTLTTIAVFGPLGFIGGIIGAFFLPFALVVTYSLLASLVVALTVVPVLGSFLIRGTERAPEGDTVLQRVYTPILRWSLGHRLWTLLGAAGIFIGSLGLLAGIPVAFITGGEQNILVVQMTAPPGTPIEGTLAQLDEVEAALAALKDEGTVDIYRSRVGGTGGGFGPGQGGPGSLDSASILVILGDGVDAVETIDVLRSALAGEGRTIAVSLAGGGGPDGSRMELVLAGEDYGLLAATALSIVDALGNIDGLIDVRTAAVPLEALPGGRPTQMSRINGRQAVTVTGTITAQNTQGVSRAVDAEVERLGLPDGVQLETGGVFADIEELFSQMIRAMVIGIVLVYAVMMVSQRSLVTPFVIILTLPLASIGALGALFITQRTLGLSSLLGLLMLIGLVVTNAIVLIAFVEQLRKRGLSVYDALMEGGRTRLRPILMTAFTTSFALLPLAVFISESAGVVGAELATVVIGGLMTSTMLTLVVTPVIYSLLRRERKPKVVAGPVVAGASDP
ncbi:MAG: efflux RND transporter permease subunit [Chloroflexi bacterium]|nr:efflux RND transporter permease subunit [Chloroflexota bacterium]